MKNLKSVSRKSHVINRIPLYYSFETDGVYTTPEDRRYFVTFLIRENSETEIKDIINRWMRI